MAGKGTLQKRGSNTWLLTVACGLNGAKKQIRKTKTVTVEQACELKSYTGCQKITRCRARGEAEKELALFIDRIEKGQYIAPSKLTFSDFVARWMRDYAETNLEPKTVEFYNEKLTRILEAMGHLKIEQIKPTHLLEFYANLQKGGVRLDGKPGGLSANNIRHHHRVISSIMQDAVEWQVIPSNPAARVKSPKVLRKQAGCYDEEQAALMLAALENEPKDKIKYKVAVTLTLATGLREGELMGLEWQDIDFAAGTLEVRQASQYLPGRGTFTKEPKSEASKRVISVPAPVMSLLQEYKNYQAKERMEVIDMWRGFGPLSCFNETFDAAAPKDVTTVKVFKSLKKDKAAIANWQDNIKTLEEKVNNKELINELKRLGENAALETAALCTLTDNQLKEFIALLKEKMQSPGEGRLFTTWDGRPMHTYTVGAWFRKFLAKTVMHKPCGKVIGNVKECPHCEKPVKDGDIIKLPALPFHGLRHTAATLLIGQGLHAKVISGRLGHSNIGITMDTYGHFLKSADREAADKLEHLFNGTGKTKVQNK
ncbi:MAG: tyrosine-type recombinase/integrase [Bacillota bacterium]